MKLADYWFEKISNAHAPLLLFNAGVGIIRATKITTSLAQECLSAKNRGRVIGVYDDKCKIEWLRDDFAYMNIE